MNAVTRPPLPVESPDGGIVERYVFPASFAQQRLWFLEQLEGPSSVYNVRLPVRLAGPLDIPALERAVGAVVARHESLRTTFEMRGAEAVQVVTSRLDVPVEREDLPGASEEQLRARLGELSASVFDLRHGPLLRVFLLRLAPEDHALLLVSHHIISDAWSSGVLFRDLAACYEAACRGRSPALPELPVQYADFAAWQRDWLAGAELERQSAFWRQHLAGAPALLELPTDRPRPALQSYRGHRLGLALPAALTTRLHAVAAEEGVTLFMLLFSAFNVLLARWSGQTDLVVGTPIAGRRRSELEGLIGFFANTLALRTQLGGVSTFRELLRQVRSTALEAFDHQDLPFEKLVEVLNPPRNLARAPIFQVMFIVQNAPWEATGFGELQVAPAEIAPGDTARFELTVSAVEFEGCLWFGLEYNTDLFDAQTIERLGAGFEALLAAVADEPGAALVALPVQAASDRQRALDELNDTHLPYPGSHGVYALFATQAQRTPAAPAVESGDGTLSYAQLEARARLIAGRLMALGVGPGRAVAICLDRSTDMLAAVLGVLCAGAHYVPLDPTHPAARLAFILEDSGAEVLIAGPPMAGLLPGFRGAVLAPASVYESVGAPSGAIHTSTLIAPEGAPTAGNPGDLAYLIYTSGSTGQPKGVEVPQRAVVNFLRSMAQTPGVGPGDRLLAVTTLAFDIAGLELLLPLTVGATTVIASRDEVADPRSLMQRLAAARINVMQATPAAWRNLIAAGWAGQRDLRMLCGGEALDATLARELCARGAELWNMYGPTETTVWSCCGRVDAATASITVGRPIANTRCYVLDDEQQPVPVGVRGELWIGGDGVAIGYHGRPELTAERFRRDPFAQAPTARMYRTGDRARWRNDGRIELLGRTDFQLKLRGFRIEPGEIEAALCAHPSVHAAVVVLRDAGAMARLVAYVVPSAAEVPVVALTDHLRLRVPDYMVPVVFVWLPVLPLSPNGKVDRAALPAPAREGLRGAGLQPVGSRTPVEVALCSLFAEVLGIAAVGVDEDFFALGGHSLLATQLISRVRDALNFELPLKTLFLTPTVAGLAAAFPDTADVRRPARVPQPAAARDRAPLSLVQQRLWFLDRLQPGNAVYNLAWAFRLRGVLDREALQAAIDALVARHGILRTRFVERDGEPWQEIGDANADVVGAALAAIRVGFEAVDTGDVGSRLKALLRDTRFDLATGPLLRITVLQANPTEQVLLLVMHHIIADGWSLAVLSRELSALYDAQLRGERAALPALPLQYADFAIWQRAALAGGELERQLGYWREALDGAPPFLDLPLDRARPAVATHRGARFARTMPRELQDALHALARSEGCTLFMVLLAAFDLLLARYAGTEDVVVGTPVAGRSRTELEGLIGFFVNTLVLRADLRGNPRFRELLAQLKRRTLDAYAHADVPFEQLVEVLKPPRDTGRTPLVQVLFNLHNEPTNALELAGLELTPLALERGTAKFDLSVSLTGTAFGLAVSFEYSTDLFLPESIERFAADFEALLTGVAADPAARLDSLFVADPDSRRSGLSRDLLSIPRSSTATLPAAFASQLAANPDGLAVSAPGAEWSYATLNGRAESVASALVAAGVARGTPVGLWFPQGAGQVAGMLGVLQAGAAYVPLDPGAPAARLATVVRDAGLRVVVSERSALASPGSTWLEGCGLTLVLLDELPPGPAGSEPSPRIGADDLAYLLYTSGSTGTPKGVPQTHRNVLHHVQAWARNLELTPSDRLSLVSTYGYDAAVQDIFGALLTGAAVHPLDIRRLDRETLLDRIAGSALTVLHATPTVYRYLFGGHVACRQDLSRIRLVVLGGEAARRADFELFRSRFRKGARFVNGYGLTEATVALQWFAEHGTRPYGGIVPLGRAVGDQRVLLLDEQGNPAGVTGEIVIESRYVTPGYWPVVAPAVGAPSGAITLAEEIAPEGAPTAIRPTAGRIPVQRFRTGDLGRYLPDGSLAWVARRDEQVKIGGIRIEPGEIEAALRSHPAIDAVAVISREEVPGEPMLVAYFTLTGSDAPTTSEMRAHLKTLLPEALVPARYVQLASLPQLPNGKRDRRALAARPLPAIAAGAAIPDVGAPSGAINSISTHGFWIAPEGAPTTAHVPATGVADTDAIEATLTELWKTLLNRPGVGRDEDFFALGGHSLLATRLIARVRDRLGIELPLISVFEAPTIRGLAQVLARRPGGRAATVAIRRQARKSPQAEGS